MKGGVADNCIMKTDINRTDSEKNLGCIGTVLKDI
jgi:hypothetical protein